MPEYDYADIAGYARARADWVSYGQPGQTVIRQEDLDRWDQAIHDLKAVVFNVKDFGAKGDATTNDAAAIQAAINACNAASDGGVVFFPRGRYACSSALSIPCDGVILQGETSPPAGPSMIDFTGAAGGIDVAGFSGFRIRDLYVVATSLSFAGILIDLDGCALARIEDCHVSLAIQAGSTSVGVSLHGAQMVAITRCNILGGDVGVRGRSSAGGGTFSNSVNIEKCWFQYQDDVPILNPYQQWRVRDNTFEPRRDGAAAAVRSAAGIGLMSLQFEGNWTGDVADAVSGDWLDVAGISGEASTVFVAGNMFDSGGSAVRLADDLDTLAFIGNRCRTMANAIDFNSQPLITLDYGGNALAGVAARFAGFGTITNCRIDGARPAVKARKTASQAVAHATGAAVAFDAADEFDTDAQHDPATNNTRLTCTIPGRYKLYTTICFDIDADGWRTVLFRRNGTDYLGGFEGPAHAFEGVAATATTTCDLAVGDYVEVVAVHGAGASLNLLSGLGNGIPTVFGWELVG
jgi:hypothetical protein